MSDKYTPIHNEVLEHLCRINLSPYETRILFAVWRKTYGFKDKFTGKRKKKDWISRGQFAQMTGLDRRLVSRALKGLEIKGVISRDDKNVSFSKKFYSGNVISRDDIEASSLSSILIPPVINFDTSMSSILIPPSITKENNKRKYTKRKKHPRLFEFIWNLYPNKDGKKASWRRFCEDIRTKQDWKNIKSALVNYKDNLKRESWKKTKSASTWFNNWRDWIRDPTLTPELVAKQKKEDAIRKKMEELEEK